MSENYTPAAEERADLPWLIFTLNEQAYAVNSKYVKRYRNETRYGYCASRRARYILRTC